nr:hypothetical protein [Bordetella ansorpii]
MMISLIGRKEYGAGRRAVTIAKRPGRGFDFRQFVRPGIGALRSYALRWDGRLTCLIAPAAMAIKMTPEITELQTSAPASENPRIHGDRNTYRPTNVVIQYCQRCFFMIALHPVR